MKLYFAPGASSLASHIALREAGLSFELEKVDLRSKSTESGSDFMVVNSKGAVPALQLDSGDILTEGAVILQYIADLAGSRALAPETGTFDRYRLMEWLNLIATDLHKNFSPFFNPQIDDACKAVFGRNLTRFFAIVDAQLAKTPYLMGETFSVADAYLFTVCRYIAFAGLDLADWPALKAHFERVRERPAVQEALKAEGL